MDDATAAAPSPLSDHLRTEVDALAAMLPSPHAAPIVFAAADDPPPPTARFEPPVADAWTDARSARPPGAPPTPGAPRPLPAA